MVNRSVPYILTVAIGLILGFCAYHFLMPIPVKIVENTHTVTIRDTIYIEGTNDTTFTTKWHYKRVMLPKKDIDTSISDDSFSAHITVFNDTLDFKINVYDKIVNITRTDTLKIFKIDSVFIPQIIEIEKEVPWYQTYTFGMVSGAVITTGILYYLRK